MSEFELINQYFKTASIHREDVVLGIGDDCALLSPPPGKHLAVSTDTLISGVHFPKNTKPEDIGYKSLAVNLSDLAAMGAEPAWVSLAISLPEADHQWIASFMAGFTELASLYNVSLIGGDTTRGPLSVTMTVTGFVSAQSALKRSTAKTGDTIFVTGTLGDARLALDILLNNEPVHPSFEFCLNRLNRPQARVEAGLALSAFQVAAIDLSDGLLADLGHICKASGTGAIIYLDKLPLSKQLKGYYQLQPNWQTILTAGDDYELCFSCAKSKVEDIMAEFKSRNIPLTCIGEMTGEGDIQCLLPDGSQLKVKQKGYNHFDGN